jgi:predicted transcriptional regulator
MTDGMTRREKEIFTAVRAEKGGSPTGLVVCAAICTVILSLIILVPQIIYAIWKNHKARKVMEENPVRRTAPRTRRMKNR